MGMKLQGLSQPGDGGGRARSPTGVGGDGNGAMAVFFTIWAAFKNLATQEGMDAAQLAAKTLTEGRGYTTHFAVRWRVFRAAAGGTEAGGLTRGCRWRIKSCLPTAGRGRRRNHQPAPRSWRSF